MPPLRWYPMLRICEGVRIFIGMQRAMRSGILFSRRFLRAPTNSSRGNGRRPTRGRTPTSFARTKDRRSRSRWLRMKNTNAFSSTSLANRGDEMIRICSRIFFISLCVLCTQMVAQQSAAYVQGVVVDAASNTSLSKAIVELRVPGTRTAIASTRTDRDGRFYLPNVTPGSYSLVATHSGHVFAEYGQRMPGAPGTTLSLGPGQRIVDARIS